MTSRRIETMIINSQGYYQRVIRTKPEAYYRYSEISGTTALDSSGNGLSGTHQGTTIGQSGPFGTCGLYDGLNDVTLINSAACKAKWKTILEGGEFSIGAWCKVYNSGVWTDGLDRHVIKLLADANNFVYFRKSSTNNTIQLDYSGGATFDRVSATYSSTDWFHLLLTLSLTGNAMKGYINGAQVGSTQTGLGTFVGVLSTMCIIGAIDAVPTSNIWYGWMDEIAIWSKILSTSEIASVSRH